MKKYKIGKRIIAADSMVEAVKIVKMLDSPNTKVVNDTFIIEKGATFKSRSTIDPWVIRVMSINNDVITFQTMRKRGDKIQADHIEQAPLDKFKRLLESRYRQTSSIYDSEIDELTQEEQQAVEDYREAIKNTSNPKLLEIYSHILKEETEHLEELAQAREYEDSCGKMKDMSFQPNKGTIFTFDGTGQEEYIVINTNGPTINGEHTFEYRKYIAGKEVGPTMQMRYSTAKSDRRLRAL